MFCIFVAYESINLDTCENFEKSICGSFDYQQNVSAEGLQLFPCLAYREVAGYQDLNLLRLGKICHYWDSIEGLADLCCKDAKQFFILGSKSLPNLSHNWMHFWWLRRFRVSKVVPPPLQIKQIWGTNNLIDPFGDYILSFSCSADSNFGF